MSRGDDVDVSIHASDLSISRGGVRVVDGVSFSLAPAGVLVVRGSTGAGKSTLASVLAGQGEAGVAVAGGDATVQGVSVRKGGRSRRTLAFRTGYLAQGAGAALPARLTVSEVIGEPITSRDRRVNAQALAVRVATLLDEMQLPLGAAVKYPYELSAGMRQRVALARALVLEPKLLVADDLFANLDVEVRAVARDAILRRQSGWAMSTLLVTNDAEAAAELDADVLVLHGGHAVAYGHGPADLLWTPDGRSDYRSPTR